MVGSREAVDEEADGDEEPAREHKGYSEFGATGVVVASFERTVDLMKGVSWIV